MSIFDNFRWDRFLFSLTYMWQGMLCIFVVISVIILSVMLLNRITERSERKKEDRSETGSES